MSNIFHGCQPVPAAEAYTGRKYGENPIQGRKSGPARQYPDSLIFLAVCDHLEGLTNKQICERHNLPHATLSGVLLGRSYRNVVKEAKVLYLQREQQCQHEAMEADDE